jgi:hypothetical protein
MTQILRFALPSGHMQDYEDTISALSPTATSNQLEQALKRLGEFLGFHAERPERDYGVGPDVLWLPTKEEIAFVIECKGNKAASSRLSKTDHGQLLVSTQWCQKQYPHLRPIRIVLHCNNIATEPAMADGTCAFTFEGLARLTTALRLVLNEVCLHLGSSQQRLQLCDRLLTRHRLTVAEIEDEYFLHFEVAR